MILNLSGGTAAPPFCITGGPSRPQDPAENTLWVQTETPIPAWHIAYDAPAEPLPGQLWLRLGPVSTIVLNALRENAALLKLDACSQYEEGAWLGRALELYQGGVWLGMTAMLFDIASALDASAFPGGELKETHLQLTQNTSSGREYPYRDEVELTGFSTLYLKASRTRYSGSANSYLRLKQAGETLLQQEIGGSSAELALDVRSLQGTFQLAVSVGSNSYVKLQQMRLEV